MRCILCRQDKSSGRACLFSSRTAADETIRHLMQARRTSPEPLFVCRDCTQSVLSKVRRRGYAKLVISLLFAAACIAGLFAADFAAEAILPVGIMVFILLLFAAYALDIILHTQRERFVHQVYHYAAIHYQKTRAFRKYFKLDKTLKRRLRAGKLWFAVNDGAVRYLGYSKKNYKKLKPAADAPDVRQARETAVGELIRQSS